MLSALLALLIAIAGVGPPARPAGVTGGGPSVATGASRGGPTASTNRRAPADVPSLSPDGVTGGGPS
jgi:hypothetical protein